MPRPKVTGVDTLEQWARENPIQHRGLLLFAMQAEHNPNGILGRSLNAVAKAVGRSHTTVRAWCRDRRWQDRVLHHGTEASAYAIALYRQLYLRVHGAKELPVVQHLCEVQVGPLDATTTEVQEEAQRVLRRVIPPPAVTEEEVAEQKEEQERVKTALEKAKEQQVQQNRALCGVAMRALNHFNDQVKEGKVRVSISDLPALSKLIEKLDTEHLRLTQGAGAAPDPNSLAVAKSVRVKLAEATGGDILQAHLDDLEEARIILMGVKKLPPEETGLGLVPVALDAGG